MAKLEQMVKEMELLEKQKEEKDTEPATEDVVGAEGEQADRAKSADAAAEGTTENIPVNGSADAGVVTDAATESASESTAETPADVAISSEWSTVSATDLMMPDR